MDKDSKVKMKKQVLMSIARESREANAGSTITTFTSGSAPAPKTASVKPIIFVIDVLVLSTVVPPHDFLPAPIDTNLPYIKLKLGSNTNTANNPVLHCIIDTAATLTTSNFHFVSAVTKKFPHCLTKLYIPNDYTPIILLGIVQRGGESVSTKLTVGFQFHLPYFTRTGQPTRILIATGPHVMVNMIVGLLFIQATGMVIDLSNHVADLRTLHMVPFPLEYRRATVHIPIINEGTAPVNLTYYGDIIAKTENLEKHYAATTLTTMTNVDATHHVTFGASPVTPAPSPPSIHDSILHRSLSMIHCSIESYHKTLLGTAAFL